MPDDIAVRLRWIVAEGDGVHTTGVDTDQRDVVEGRRGDVGERETLATRQRRYGVRVHPLTSFVVGEPPRRGRDCDAVAQAIRAAQRTGE